MTTYQVTYRIATNGHQMADTVQAASKEAAISLVSGGMLVEVVSVNEVPAANDAAPVAALTKTGRPAKHADAAAKQRAWRAAHKVKTLRLDGKVGPTVEQLAQAFGTTETHVVNNMLRFALANHDWANKGIGGWAMKDMRCAKGRREAPAERDDSFDNFSLV